MPTPSTCSDEEFIALIEKYGCAGTAKYLNINQRSVFRRRAKLEADNSIQIKSATAFHGTSPYTNRINYDISDGVIIVGSDAHYWPGLISVAHRGLIQFCKELKPKALILNGDVLDGAGISRHPPIGWNKLPTLKEELQAAEERLDELRLASQFDRFWIIGNHDARFENRLSSQVPEYVEVDGMRLSDHFPHWQMAWSLWINQLVVIKHRFKGGIHATHNNTLWAGKTIVTGHLHSLKVTPFSDYNGTRYGVDTGTLADPVGPQFAYIEENPINHRSGFVVLTFHKGKLLLPEIASVDGETIQFRGQVIAV